MSRQQVTSHPMKEKEEEKNRKKNKICASRTSESFNNEL
jgi:hypothetical protein